MGKQQQRRRAQGTRARPYNFATQGRRLNIYEVAAEFRELAWNLVYVHDVSLYTALACLDLAERLAPLAEVQENRERAARAKQGRGQA